MASADGPAPAAPAGGVGDLRPFVPLLEGVRDLKRVRPAHGARDESVLGELFNRAWLALEEGRPPEAVAYAEAARALAAVRLGALDGCTLQTHGLTRGEARDALLRAFRDVAGPLDARLRERLEDALDADPPDALCGFEFVDRLLRQPRAGATRPGVGRLILEPPETCADHSAAVAVYGLCLAPRFGADPAEVFFVGIAHHLFNASLPDAGFVADRLLGDRLSGQLTERAFEYALEELPDELRARTERALAITRPDRLDTPEARAFHTADALDRVLEMAWHARAARFTLRDALGDEPDEFDVVHPGFAQEVERAAIRAAGLWPAGLSGA